MGKGRCELMEWAWSLRLMVDSNKKLRPCCVMRWWIPQGNLGSIRGRGARSSLFLFIVQRWWWCGSPSTVQRALHLWLLPGAIKRAASGGSSVTSLLSSSDIYFSFTCSFPLLPRDLTKDIYQPPTTKEKEKNIALHKRDSNTNFNNNEKLTDSFSIRFSFFKSFSFVP